MKLYTEEQVKEVWKAGQKYWETSGASITLEELLEQLTSIELPSDVEIEEEAQKQWGNVHRTGVLGFLNCAKWMRDKLTNIEKK